MEHADDEAERIICENESKENIEEEPCTSNESHRFIDEEVSNALGTMEIDKTTDNRVKLYVLCEQKAWEDKGTGHVACICLPKKPSEYYLIVRLENEDRNILESRILETTKYNRQQGTLIVWNESETVDLALSFQEKQGCEEMFHEILKAQTVEPSTRHPDTDDENESDSSESIVSNWTNTFSLPVCDLLHVGDLENIISSSLGNSNSRTVIAAALCRGEYLDQLCTLFDETEEMNDETINASFASVAKDMFLLNDQTLLTEMINEKRFKSFVGMLEYDASLKKPKKHREFLYKHAQFREVLPLANPELKEKIDETFRLQYVQDVCLPAPSIFEENLLTAISGNIFFNRVEIVGMLMNDTETLKQLFSELKQRDIPPQRQKDLTGFLKEFCHFAQSLQPNGQQGRETFFKMLMQNDVFQILDPCMSSSLPVTQAMTVDLLGLIVDFSLKLFKEFLQKQEGSEDDLLINKMCYYMMNDKDPEFANARNMAEVMRVLLDPESPPSNDYDEFFQFFYKKCMPTLVRPIKEVSFGVKGCRDDHYTCRQMCMILTILVFCVKNHESQMRTFVIQNDLLTHVTKLLKSKHHLSGLKALRFIRRIIDTKDEIYYRYIKEKKIFKPIVEAFLANGDTYNLLNSCFLDLFEFIQHDNIFTLIDYIGADHMTELEHITYVKTFAELRRKYDTRRHDDVRKNETTVTTPIKQLPERFQTAFEREKRYEEDEHLFDDDNDVRNENELMDEEPEIVNKKSLSLTPTRKSGAEPMFSSIAKRKKNNEDEGVASVFGGTAAVPSISVRPGKITIKMSNRGDASPLSPSHEEVAPDAVIKHISLKSLRKSSLVDYDDSDSDSDDENAQELSRSPLASLMSSPKTAEFQGLEPVATTSETMKSPLKRTDSSSPEISNGEVMSRKRSRPSDEDAKTEKRPRSDSPKRDHRYLNGYSSAGGDDSSIHNNTNSNISPQSCSAEAANESTSGLKKRIYGEDNEEDEKLIQVEMEVTNNPTSTPPRSPATTA